jgi:hypothetical protein
MEPEKSILKEFINGGWIIPLIGAGGMLARLISSEKQFQFVEQLKKIITATIASTIAWFLLEHTDISSLYKAMTYGIIGVISPEIINGLIVIGKKFEKNAHKQLFK